MTNILFVSTYLARNGTEAFMINVFRNLDKSKYHADFLCFSREDIAYDKEIEAAGSTLTVLPQRSSGLGYYHSLKSFFKKNMGKYEVLHWCACSCTSVAPLYYAAKYKIPIRIIHSHNSSVLGIHNHLLHRILRPFANTMATDRVACSEKAAVWFFGKRKSLVLTNGIQVNKFIYNSDTRKYVRDKFGFTEHTRVIGHVGRFDPVKNHSKLLEIFDKFLMIEKNSRLMLIGIGALEESIMSKATEMGLSDKVLFLRERSDVPQLLQAMDCFVMPSLYEGLPFVLVEAQAAGLPCVVSDTVDKHAKLTDILSFMSLESSSDIWARQANILMNNPRKDTSAQIVASGYSIEQTVNNLEKIYDGHGTIVGSR